MPGVAGVALHPLREHPLGSPGMKLAGYTLGQMVIIVIIAVVGIFLLKKIDERVAVPGVHELLNP